MSVLDKLGITFEQLEQLTEQDGIELGYTLFRAQRFAGTIWTPDDVDRKLEDYSEYEFTPEQIGAVRERVLNSYAWDSMGEESNTDHEALRETIEEAFSDIEPGWHVVCPENPVGVRHQVTSGSCDHCGAKNFS